MTKQAEPFFVGDLLTAAIDSADIKFDEKQRTVLQ